VWEATAENVRGQLKSVNKNGITQTFDYDAAGRTTSINTTKSTPNPGYSPTIDWLVKMEYGYTTDGNLDFRKEFRDGNSQEYQRENFGYDEFNRLTSWAITKINASTPALTHSITYDPTTGNITNKSDVGSMNMLYDNTSAPHRLTKIDGVPASVSSLTLDISYTDFDKVKKITRASDFPGPNKRKDYDITYGVDDQRITSTYSSGLYKKISTTYLGNYEVEEDSLGNIKKTHYLQGAIYIQTVKADGTTSEQFYSTISDFQGSLIALVDEHGTVAERYAFDPWGARRNPDDWTQTDARTSWITHRGYTGHEHIDVFGVINMNGRVYDPMTAAFFSPDPFVQSAGDWMNYNRYTYCMNNPFRYTDPSGNFWEYLVSMIVMTGFNYLNAVAQNNWDFKNTPLTNVQIGYGSNYGVYGGVSFDNGMSYANVGSGFNGATLGFTYAGNTSMQYIPTYAIPNSVAKAEANAREKYLFARGLEATGGIPDYYGSGDAQSQLEFTWSRPDLVPSSGGGNTLNAVGTGVGLLGLSSDIAKESGYVTTIGTNLKPYASGWAGNQFVKTVGIAKGVGTVTFVAGSFIDGALYFMKNPETGQPYQSGAKTLTNIGVSGTAMYLGGIPGIILGGGYMLIDKTVGWDRVMTPASNDQWVPNRAVFPDGTTIYVCFKAGTQIFAKGGSKSIEHIVVGDSVYSYNLEKNIVELSKVVKSFERKTQEIYELTTDNQKIYVTAEHPFYVVGNGWVKVKDLKAGAVLKTKDGSIEHVTSSVLEKHPETVYNIEVEGNHNYFVTNSNILVHNK
jgi:RHS repeat-associated protein